ncbi:MAG: hypothetical protein HXO88_08590 [Streptococcus intermedius]|uniref:Uncharacterized protein n=1 Tax=Streptococcus intermedius TaxID=1338 RepID=A0A930RDN0_STRIT|nr:hypothetical protein [Streptococcus intermedius]
MVRKSVEEIKLEVIGRIERYFGDRASEVTICELVDVPNHYILRLVFRAYDYYWVQFNYDNDLCGFSIVLNDEFGVSLENEMRSYMGTKDWDSYLKEIMAEIELRISDEFLKAKGWL